MGKVPDSRLMLLCPEGEARERVLGILGKAGITADRVEFVGMGPFAEYFARYQRMDIALDPFPYGGGTTTCDALWMGVPVVTLRGKTAVGRGGVSILTNVGLPELIAGSEAEYEAIALELARDEARRQELRGSLRERMRTSALMDAPGFARDVEGAYREMWRN